MEVKSKKNMLYSTLENSPAKINWVKNENLHLTLKFIGHTRESYIPKIKDSLKGSLVILTLFNYASMERDVFQKKKGPERCLWGLKA